MKKFILFSLLYLICGIALESCNKTYQIVSPGNIYVIDGNTNEPTDTLGSNDFILILYGAYVQTTGSLDFHLFNQSYALQKYDNIVNPPDYEYLKLRLNKDFHYNGSLVPAFTDLAELEEIRKEIDIPFFFEGQPTPRFEIHFSKAFFESILIDPSPVEITISTETVKGDAFEHSITTVIIP